MIYVKIDDTKNY